MTSQLNEDQNQPLVNPAVTCQPCAAAFIDCQPAAARSGRFASLAHALLIVSVSLATVASQSGCGDDEPEQEPMVVVPPAPPPPPPPPAVTSVTDLMAQLNIDPRVQLPEKFAPADNEGRIAVLKFFDAIVRGNEAAAGAMMSETDKEVLAGLVANGSWRSATSGLELVELRCGQRPSDSRPCVLAIMHSGDAEQPGLWNFVVSGSTATFDAEPTPPDVASKLSGTNWIESWYGVLDGYIALAAKPDEDIALPQAAMGNDGDTGAGGEPAPPEGGGGGGANPPMRNRPGPSPGG